MAHYAKIEDGVVTNVIVAEQDFIDTQEGTWVQTSYNTFGGVHANGETPLRKNYAGIGYTYDAEKDMFTPPNTQPPSFTLNEVTGRRETDVPMPDGDDIYGWNENIKEWYVVDVNNKISKTW